jgi:asparagine synthase (glutamine-hydrolysing)
MCGFVGFFAAAGWSVDQAERTVAEMNAEIHHRGPDYSGCWLDPLAQVALGHQRLAIVDLSPAGHQPMAAHSGRYVIVFNGEIYNHLKLRSELTLENIAWRGHSDTETLLAGFDVWGIKSTIEKAIGMFAMAVWDRQLLTLTLVRDRLGEKPLYYGWQGDAFLFGSELKALKKHPEFKSEIDRNALALLMRHMCIPAPYSIYQGIAKLEPGCILTVSLADKVPQIQRYWSATQVVEQGITHRYQGDAQAAVTDLDALLRDSVAQQMMADVPLGAFLSGGVDSSLVVSLMQAQSTRPIKTFSIGFQEDRFNEAQFAKEVARHLGTDHTELYITAQQAMDVIPLLPELYDEPFADSSQIPTFLVSQLARQHVTVSLSGDAGDELFCGYNRYTMTHQLWRSLQRLPRPLRGILARGIKLLSPGGWDALANLIQAVLPKRYGVRLLGDKLHKAANILNCASADELYLGLVSTWPNPELLVLEAEEPLTSLTDSSRMPKVSNDVERMMALDMVSFLPDDILVKVDRAAMAVSLETRVPFLDHRVVEFACSLPLEYKLREGQSKWALRQVLYKYVPKSLIERPKMGFGVPIDEWLRGPLRQWAESLIDESRLRSEGYLSVDLVHEKWQEHLSGKRNWCHQLWCVLMFQVWLENEKRLIN